MKKWCIGLLVPLSLATASCATLAVPALDAVVSAAKPAAVVSDKVVLEGKRGLILASNAYQAAGAVIVPLIDADKLTAAQVARVSQLNQRVADLLRGTEAGLTLAERAAGVLNAADELNRMAGR